MRRPTPPSAARLGPGTAAVAAAVLVAACGGGASTVPSKTTSTAPLKVPAATSKKLSSPTTLSSPAQVARCERTAAARPGLTPGVRAELNALCTKAHTESPIELRKALAKACADMASTMTLPAGVDRSQAIAACQSV